MFLQTRKLFLKKLQEVKQCSLFQKCETRLEKDVCWLSSCFRDTGSENLYKATTSRRYTKTYVLPALSWIKNRCNFKNKQTDESRCTCYLFFFTALLQGFHQIYVLIFISFHHNFHVLNTNQSFLYLFIYIFLPNFR